ncbi:MAG: NUDIX domain-containing protein [Candidatus Pacebacteria bacterium]|nr:NUDIX domain-containing protein [Candidatus Paceibacterota bacterium]
MDGVNIIIEDGKGNYLIQQRSDDAPIWPNSWGLWGGGIDEGESPILAAIRELEEETGIRVGEEKLTHFKTYTFVSKRTGKMVNKHVYILLLEPEMKIVLGEGKGYAFFNKDELVPLTFADRPKQFLFDYIASKNESAF